MYPTYEQKASVYPRREQRVSIYPRLKEGDLFESEYYIREPIRVKEQDGGYMWFARKMMILKNGLKLIFYMRQKYNYDQIPTEYNMVFTPDYVIIEGIKENPYQHLVFGDQNELFLVKERFFFL